LVTSRPSSTYLDLARELFTLTTPDSDPFSP
jgi:hypothetical protein